MNATAKYDEHPQEREDITELDMSEPKASLQTDNPSPDIPQSPPKKAAVETSE